MKTKTQTPEASTEQPITTPAEQEVAQETGQTGQRDPYFEVQKDGDGEFHWILYSGNGRAMAMNVEAYPRLNDCTSAINAFRTKIKPNTRILVAK